MSLAWRVDREHAAWTQDWATWRCGATYSKALKHSSTHVIRSLYVLQGNKDRDGQKLGNVSLKRVQLMAHGVWYVVW